MPHYTVHYPGGSRTGVLFGDLRLQLLRAVLDEVVDQF
jgi:hypothetical protein